MIKTFINKLLGRSGATRSSKSPYGQRQDVGPQDHGIDPGLVDQRAADVVHTLKAAGFEAYIVGGAVRDLILGLRPKDFDVATNATPEQVKGLFRRAFIIGRRFRIVHVVYGRGREHEVIEVSTFRAHLDSSQAQQVGGNERTSKSELAGMKHAVDASGRVLRDNVWGSIDHDAARRDFSINAMYYDPETQIVVDYHQGIRDAKKRVLRMIGDPVARYREDPVRIIRAVRFAAKLSGLGFKLEDKTGRPLREMMSLLADVPQSRLFDEMLKLLQTGHAVASIAQLKTLGLERGIYPLLDVIVAGADEPFLRLALEDTDRRVREDKPVAPSFLLAAVLWSDVKTGWDQLRSQGMHPMPALHQAIDSAFDARIGDVSGRGKLGIDMREIWTLQPRFEKRVGSGPYTLVEQPRFRAGLDFLRLRSHIGEVDAELAAWWEKFSLASDDEREDMMQAVRQQTQPRATRLRGRGKAEASAQGQAEPRDGQPAPADAADVAQAGMSGDGLDDAPRKRRRRRRSRSGDAGEGGAGDAPPRGDGAA
jgi:poly(A) polymerase